MIIDGRKIRDNILEEVKKEIKTLNFQPLFCDVLVGDDPVSRQYVEMKAKTAESIGIKFHNVYFPESIKNEDLILEIEKIKDIPNMCGLIVQLPLPAQFDKQKILNAISPSVDVDCLNEETSNLFYSNKSLIGFPTALACVEILDSLNTDLENKNIVVLGRGMLVGKPVAYILKNRGYKVEVVSSQTENANEIIKNADVIISAMGKGKFIKGDMIKEGAIVIDAGTSESTGGIVGDVDLESVEKKASYISPVPGGVGPVTVAILLKNVLLTAKNK